MYTDKIIKREKYELIINIILGVVLLTIGIVFRVMNVHFTENNKAIIGVSFIPFAIAINKLTNIHNIKKHPKSMSTVIVAENDERLIMQRNEAEAISNRIFRWVIYLVFIGYSLMLPSEAFEATGWRAVLLLFLLSYILPCFFYYKTNAKYDIKDN